MKLMKNILFAACALLIWSCTKPKKIEEKDGMVLLEGQGNIKSFWIEKTPVTVADFDRFVSATHYITEAEKFGDAGYFDFKTGIWGLKKGCTWRYPLGTDTTAAPMDHPVTQVSWNDAVAYCKWVGKRLPTSEEFVFAEKNGEEDYEQNYTWGQNYEEEGKFKANFWQGSFPFYNTVEDGFLTTSPVGYFGYNKIHLADLGGNVWQWCSDQNPEKPGEWFQRGGSYLCDPKVCHGFKVGGISSSTQETSLPHVGFRCVKDI
jgi:formylglycine-generating enzyme